MAACFRHSLHEALRTDIAQLRILPSSGNPSQHRLAIIFRQDGVVLLHPEKPSPTKNLIFNRIRECSDFLLAFALIDFLRTIRFLPSFSGC
jgi:hypothetical protein